MRLSCHKPACALDVGVPRVRRQIEIAGPAQRTELQEGLSEEGTAFASWSASGVRDG
jgi:hypothetical protein